MVALLGLNAFFEDEATYGFQQQSYFAPKPVFHARNVNNNGAIEVSDVLEVLSQVGCDNGCAPNLDLDSDNSITVADVLIVLSAFGEAC